jgi:hypothetical protein
MVVTRVVLTLGVHGSASTWIFNVARELMQAALGAEAVAACYANNIGELLAERRALGRHLVCKVHSWPGLDVFAHLTRASVILTVRDPRDAVVSLMQRFGTPFDISCRGIANDCRQAAWAAAAGHPVLRYEDRFFESPAAVWLVGRHLALPVAAEEAARIFAAYRTEAVRAFAATVAQLPPDRLGGDGKSMVLDRVTQIHRTHIGDGRVGKWREHLDDGQQRDLNRFFAPFLKRFGYPEE